MKREKSGISWIVIILLIPMWPVALALLFLKLTNNKATIMNSHKIIVVIGWFLLVIGVVGGLACLEDLETNFGALIVALVIFVGGGIACIFLGKKMKITAKRYRNYINIIINQNESDIGIISKKLHMDPSKVRDDLENMIHKDFFQGAYIDKSRDEIIIQHKPDKEVI